MKYNYGKSMKYYSYTDTSSDFGSDSSDDGTGYNRGPLTDYC